MGMSTSTNFWNHACQLTIPMFHFYSSFCFKCKCIRYKWRYQDDFVLLDCHSPTLKFNWIRIILYMISLNPKVCSEGPYPSAGGRDKSFNNSCNRPRLIWVELESDYRTSLGMSCVSIFIDILRNVSSICDSECCVIQVNYPLFRCVHASWNKASASQSTLQKPPAKLTGSFISLTTFQHW